METALYTVAAAVITHIVAMVFVPRKNGNVEVLLLVQQNHANLEKLKESVHDVIHSNIDLIKESARLRKSMYKEHTAHQNTTTLITKQNSQLIESTYKMTGYLGDLDKWMQKVEARL